MARSTAWSLIPRRRRVSWKTIFSGGLVGGISVSRAPGDLGGSIPAPSCSIVLLKHRLTYKCFRSREVLPRQRGFRPEPSPYSSTFNALGVNVDIGIPTRDGGPRECS